MTLMTMVCEECGAEGAKLRCTKCKSCYYCSKGCQNKNWRGIHKRVCSTDPQQRPFVPVEMALERALTRQRPAEVPPPTEATCYICLENGAEKPLLRGCACRGDSAGYVHFDCLASYAASGETSDDIGSAIMRWRRCVNCKQLFRGTLELMILRQFWRRHRSGGQQLRVAASTLLVCVLDSNGEGHAATRLSEATAKQNAENIGYLLQHKLRRARTMASNGQKLEALTLLTSTLPQAKQYDTIRMAHMTLDVNMEIANVLLGLERHQECLETASQCVAFAKHHIGNEHSNTLHSMKLYAAASFNLGRFDESKTVLTEVLSIHTRVFGKDHPGTHETAFLLLKSNHMLRQESLKNHDDEHDDDHDSEDEDATTTEDSLDSIGGDDSLVNDHDGEVHNDHSSPDELD